MNEDTATEGPGVSENDEYDPFAAQPSQPGMRDPFSAPGQGFGSTQPAAMPSYSPPHPVPPNAVPPMPPPVAGSGPIMPPSPYGYGSTTPGGSSQKNYLGILALIFPFVLLSIPGVIVGHMGLSAVKNGTANNRGVALAGTIISWVVTALSVPAVLTAIAVPIFVDQREAAHEAAAEADLRMLRNDLEAYFVDQSDPPEVIITDNAYLVDGEVEPKSPFVDDIDFVMTGGVTYCIAVTFDGDQVRSIIDTGALSWGGCPDPQPLVHGEGDAAEGIVAFSELAAGDCITDPFDNIVEGDDGSTWVSGVTIVDCAESHYGEVYFVASMTADDYVEDDVYGEADDLCYNAYTDFMGIDYESSSYYYEPYYPSPAGWDLGDRETTCVVTAYDSETVGSVEGSGL